jgi:hypothetical protein
MKRRQIRTWNERIATTHDTLRKDIFVVVHKEHLRIDSFLVNKSFDDGSMKYTYHNSQSTFSISFDSSYQHFMYRKNADNKPFITDSDTLFTLNDHNFQVFRLLLDMDVTDGGTCYYFSPDIGILAYQSLTWHNSGNLSSQKNGMEPLVLSALLMKLYTAKDFYSKTPSIPTPPAHPNLHLSI